MLGEEGLLALIKAHESKPATERLKAMLASLQREGRQLIDDVTMLIVEAQ